MDIASALTIVLLFFFRFELLICIHCIITYKVRVIRINRGIHIIVLSSQKCTQHYTVYTFERTHTFLFRNIYDMNRAHKFVCDHIYATYARFAFIMGSSKHISNIIFIISKIQVNFTIAVVDFITLKATHKKNFKMHPSIIIYGQYGGWTLHFISAIYIYLKYFRLFTIQESLMWHIFMHTFVFECNPVDWTIYLLKCFWNASPKTFFSRALTAVSKSLNLKETIQHIFINAPLKAFDPITAFILIYELFSPIIMQNAYR